MTTLFEKGPECVHRLRLLAMEEVLREKDPGQLALLHVSPEKFFEKRFRKEFGHYMTSSMEGQDADVPVDLMQIPFEDKTFDMVFAAHVLEHVPDDRRAIAEIFRVLRPGGMAILPVPVIGEWTIEYKEANLAEEGHVRCPGKDYFERFQDSFSEVKIYASDDFPECYQLFCYEDRSSWPASMPQRPRVKGNKHPEYVPVFIK